MATTNFRTIDEYIAAFPEKVQDALQQIRWAIHEAVPEAREGISYQMPTFAVHGQIAHFAAWKKHIGFYGSFPDSLQEEISQFKRTDRGSIHFLPDKPMPLALVKEIVKFRAREDQALNQARGDNRRRR